MAESSIGKLMREAAYFAGGFFYLAAVHHGMTLEEFEGLVGAFRREVEDGIRAARVRLLERLEGKGRSDA